VIRWVILAVGLAIVGAVYGPVAMAALAVALSCAALARRLKRGKRSAEIIEPGRRGRIYLLHAPIRGLWKIGFTDRSGLARFEELQRQSPERLIEVAWGYGTMQLEAEFHRRYRHLHEANDLPADSEWFRLGQREIGEVLAVLNHTRVAT